MSSEEDTKKPPGFSGGVHAPPAASKPAPTPVPTPPPPPAPQDFYPWWWRDERKIARHAMSDQEADPFTQFGDTNLREMAQITQSPHQFKAYQWLEGLLREHASNFPNAVAWNLYRHGLNGRVVDWTAGVATTFTFAVAGSPVIGLIFGGILAAGRSVREVLKHRIAAHRKLPSKESNRLIVEMRLHMLMLKGRVAAAGHMTPSTELPHLAEFRNGWMRSAWRLTHLIMGYNTRVLTINGLMRDQTVQREDRFAARALAEMLVDERARLIRIRRDLEHLCIKEEGSYERLAAYNERLMEDDLFGDHKADPPPPDWLILPSDILLVSEVRRQYEIDREAYDAACDAETQEIDSKFAELERQEDARDAETVITELDLESDSDD